MFGQRHIPAGGSDRGGAIEHRIILPHQCLALRGRTIKEHSTGDAVNGRLKVGPNRAVREKPSAGVMVLFGHFARKSGVKITAKMLSP